MVNVGCLREFLLELSAHARLLGDFQAYDTDRLLLEYCAQYFGADHAAAVAQLHRDYYDAFWEPKRPVFPGMKRQLFHDNLRAFAGFMAHLSRALVHDVPVYQERENRTARATRLEESVAELKRAQACLWETQHGVFSVWYSGSAPMSRTFEIDQLKASRRAAREQASPQP